MNKNTVKSIRFSALLGLFSVLALLLPNGAKAVENLPITQAADKITTQRTLSAGFYQFNNLEIFKGPAVDEPPAVIEVIQRNEPDCVIYENGKTNQPINCVFDGDKNNNFSVQIDERTTLLGNNQEPALLSDFQAGEKVNILGWLSADAKTIRAAYIKSLESKNFHQSLSGTIEKITEDGFVLTLSNGDSIRVETPIVEGSQVTLKGVYDKASGIVSNVLSIIIRPVISEEQLAPTEKSSPAPVSSKKPSELFKNFLKVFGL